MNHCLWITQTINEAQQCNAHSQGAVTLAICTVPGSSTVANVTVPLQYLYPQEVLFQTYWWVKLKLLRTTILNTSKVPTAPEESDLI